MQYGVDHEDENYERTELDAQQEIEDILIDRVIFHLNQCDYDAAKVELQKAMSILDEIIEDKDIEQDKMSVSSDKIHSFEEKMGLS